MRLSPTHVGLMLASVLSMNTIAQEGSNQTGSASQYDVIEAPAITSNIIQQSVLIEVTATEQRLVAVGAHGNIIYRHRDDNNTWQQAAVPTSVLLTSVEFASNRVGWATGHHGVIIKTTDGGENWQRVLDGFQLLELEETFYQTKVADLEQQLETASDSDKGDLEWDLDNAKFQLETVQRALNDSGPSKPLLDIIPLGSERAIAVGAYNTIVETRDGGESWTLLNDQLDNPNGFHLNAISRSGQQLFIAGEAGTAYRSRNNGSDWEAVAPPYSGSFFGSHFDSQGRVWLYGLRGNVFYSTDLGDSYQAVEAGVEGQISGGYSDQQGQQWLVGNSGTIIRIDQDLQAKDFTHPSSSVLTDLIPTAEGLVLTGRSGLMHWSVEGAQ